VARIGREMAHGATLSDFETIADLDIGAIQQKI
jgi:hypothetical protein